MMRLALDCMFDLSGHATQEYMDEVLADVIDPQTGRMIRRDSSPEAAFKVVGDLLRDSIMRFGQEHPDAAHSVESMMQHAG